VPLCGAKKSQEHSTAGCVPYLNAETGSGEGLLLYLSLPLPA
jgi:hypothetical protein